MEENEQQWSAWDEILFADLANSQDRDIQIQQAIANKKKVYALREDFEATIDVDVALPEVETLILPLAVEESDLIGQGRKKKLGLKRLIRRARDDGEEVEILDHNFCDYKYKQFYSEILQQRALWSYQSSLKRFEENDSIVDKQPETDSEISNLPRCSLISAGKQRMFLKLQSKYSKIYAPLNEKNNLYKLLLKVVLKEQRDYLSFCLKQARNCSPIDYEYVLPGLIDYIERTLFHRQHSVPQKYKALYHLHSVIDMHIVSKQEISFTPVTLIHAQGRVPYTNTKSAFCKGLSLESVTDSLEFLIPSNDKLGHLNQNCKGLVTYKVPAGEDPNALHFAFENDADVITSSSVMQLLVDVHPYSLQNSASRRDIPVLVKNCETDDGTVKKLVILDKALPPLEMNLYDKKKWACSRAVKVLFSASDIKTFDFDEMEEVKTNSRFDFGQEKFPESGAKAKQTVDLISDEEEEDFPIKSPPNHNVTYGLYTLGGSQDCGRKINLVVRSNYHAYEKNSPSTNDKSPNYLHFSVKLEQQPEYGAQCTTISEISREWMALSLRKGATLCRVRVNAKTLEVIQVEKKKIKSLKHECKVRGMNVDGRIRSLHHVMSQLMDLEVGSYILQLIPIEGVARLLQHDTSETTLRGGSYYNLHLHYRKANHLIGPMSHVPYAPIDPTVPTPFHVENSRIPATFNPRKMVASPVKSTGSKDPQLFATPTKAFELDIGAEDEEEADEECDEEVDHQCDEDEQFNECSSAATWMDLDGLSACGSALQSTIENFSNEDEYSDASDSSPRVDVTKDPGDDTDLLKIFLDMQVQSPISVIE